MDIKAFQKKILTYYKENKRDLPWRKTTNPYHILISEIMLQQTQVDRVIDYYHRWLKALPDFESLARVDKQTLLTLWSGLGYNNRAIRLQKLAQEVVQNYKGKLPDNEEQLKKLPGIGPYTAGAILAFAFNKDVVVIDTNVRRVCIHELGLSENIEDQELQKIVWEALPKGNACTWYNALMDYGATYATARKTKIKSLSKQPKFEGSDRQIRGYIIKALTQKKNIPIANIKKHYDAKQTDKVIQKLIKEKLILKEESNVKLA